MGKRRHLTPKEIIAQCNNVARESRMSKRSPWSAMGIICGYVLLTSEGFKGQRIKRITDRIADMDKQHQAGDLSTEDLSKRLMDKADWSIEWKEYTEDDIKAKKGTYQYWIDQKQIRPQNIINQESTKYMLFFFTALMEEYGYGKDRLTRVETAIMDLLKDYQKDKTAIREMRRRLLEDARVVYEMPIDPLTESEESIMTGC